MRKMFFRHIEYWKKKEFVYSIFFGVLLIIFSLLINHLMSIYINSSNLRYVNDLFLDNLPVFNVDFVLNQVLWFYIFVMVFFGIRNPQKIPFILKSIALFIFIRSTFVCLTHLGPAPDRSFLDPNYILSSIASGNDMFFSGHTGMPFLLALIFWDDKIAGIFSLLASVVFGTSMLLGHLHYSIDVFSAFFITYTIFVIAQKAFKKDFKMMQSVEKSTS